MRIEIGLVLSLLVAMTTADVNFIKNTFPNPIPSESFRHMTKDENTGFIYVAGVNKIIKLSQNFIVNQSIRTGPKTDDPNCLPYEMEACLNKRPTDSYSKALVIDEKDKKLIACSSLFQGFCTKYWLSDITKFDNDSSLFMAIAANSRTATTVAFIAPGPILTGPTASDVMYVGTTYTSVGIKIVRDDIPAFCSRNLKQFELTYKGVSDSTSKYLEASHRSSFYINYIYGFSSDRFSYMATVQRESTQSEKYITKLIRVCHNDKEFYSYTEVELVCKYNGAKYNILQAARKAKPGKNLAQALNIHLTDDVLFATFSIGKVNSIEPLNDTAVCFYPLKKIKEVFTDNIRKCFEGSGNTGPDHIVKTVACQKADSFLDQITHDYCGNVGFNQPINGQDPIIATAALTLNTMVSAITVAVTNDYTVGFIGTQNGRIIKIAIESQTLAHQYEDMIVEAGAKIHEDMVFDQDGNHLFVMTNKKIYKLALQDCSQYKSCGTCQGAKDPFCGWCSLEDKCSLKTDCDNSESALRWLGYNGELCTNITSVYPDRIQRDNKISRTTSLTLNISNLPTSPGPYKCQFTGYGVTVDTKANRTSTNANTLTCETPYPNQLPQFPVDEDHIVMKLSVVINGREFVSTNFTFFDCEVHSKDACYKCTLSRFNCTWCIGSHICTHYPLQDCSETDEYVAALNSPGFIHTHTVGPKKCPLISKGTPIILVPSGKYKKVVLFAHNLRKFQQPIYCYFKIGSGRFVTARIIPHTDSAKIIECDDMEFSYIEDTKHWNVPFMIVWGQKDLNKPLDNPSHVQVRMYKCEMMGDSCGRCLIIPSDYNCGWCDSRCSIQGDCTNSIWLHSSSTCPNPKILRIYPLSGPKKGGTELTIEGMNLGRTYEDIVSYVDVAGISCSPIREKYKAPSRIVCETGQYFDGFPTKGPARVTVNGQYLAQSKQIFSYVTPNISSIVPTQGAQSGGTEVTIKGQSMNAGTNISVSLDNVPCSVISKAVDHVICITQPTNKTKTATLSMTFDSEMIMSNLLFTFVKDPIILSAKPRKSIKSGGLPVRVTGQRLNIIQRPKIIIWGNIKGEKYEGSCEKAGSTEEMICLTPYVDIDILHRRKREEQDQNTPYKMLQFGFKLDNVKTYLVYGNFSIYPDPDFEPFDASSKPFQGSEYLTIKGKYLTDTAFDHTQVKVQIGKDNCEVKSVQYLLTCLPPKSQPESLNGGQYPEVIVSIGENLTISLGALHYDENDYPLPMLYIILIAVGGGILVIAIFIIIIMYRLKSKKNDSMMKKMQNQMDNLELKVAKECKEAFAELQTDMTELTSDLYGQVAIPFWNYQTYCMRVLFPQDNTIDHPVIKDLEVDYRRRDSVEKGLALFSQLIGNKTFLLTFIRTLESHKNFSMKDKVNVASLISVALQTKMEYSTDILKTLLSDLIERSIDGKKEPKLLFRRNESVAEKMLTNWFTFLLYKFLKEVAGEPLFMLYQAMKQQVAKGPVDSASSEARYSLSEDKLIRQQIEFRQMTVYVQDMDQYQGAHPVKVLDCDTISQVKEKILDAIYKNAPFSSRPIKDDVDLVLFETSSTEWNSGTKGRLILQDDDNTTKQEGEYRRINTLLHYKVNDGAYMTLVPKQQQFNQSSLNSSEKSGGSKFYDNFPFSTRSPSLNRTVTPQNINLEMEIAGVNNKFYHLVRPHESENFNKEGTDRGSKMVSEIYLTRLLATKGTLQQFVDDLFERIFSIAHRGNALPLAIKYMFDFLDDQALLHNIQDQEVVYTWKSNSLPLRFWVNVIKNPNFVFDIYKSNIVDSCLSVVAQTFMDSCSQSPHRLGKDSPSSKLLFAKDIPKYKKWVERYYQDITMMPAISDQDMTAMMTEESRIHQDEFNTTAALFELYKYVLKYREELWQALEEDEFAKKNRLQFKLEQVRLAMDKEVYC